MSASLQATFRAGSIGGWHIDRITPVVGDALASAQRLEIRVGAPLSGAPPTAWSLKGITSNTRYTRRQEADTLSAIQEGLDRPQATRAALIPIRKSAAWWALAQDERRAIFEEQSHHIAIGLDYLPPIARRLYHCRDLGESFDFLTWFEYAPEHTSIFETLVSRLRQTPEWRFVDREVDIRLSR